MENYSEDKLKWIDAYDEGHYYIQPKDVMEKVKLHDVYALDLRDGSDFLIDDGDRTEEQIQRLIDSPDFAFFTEDKVDGSASVKDLQLLIKS